MTDICLVTMPYGPIGRPCLALGQLVASSKNEGLDIKALYPVFWFAQEIGINIYSVLSDVASPIDLIAEWTFAGAAFPNFAPDHEKYLSSIFQHNGRAQFFFETFRHES